ncbi:hypothetical protein JCM11491_005222 [Sporobolomyces phaffii]
MLSMITRTLFATGYGGQIHTLSFNPSTPSLASTSSVSAGTAPTWLTLHPTLPLLYTGDEFSSPDGVLSTFSIDDSNSSSLAPIGHAGKSKEGPVHFVLSPDGGELYSACYSAGALSSTKLLDNGTFDADKRGQTFVYGGKGPNPDRQEGPHAHGVAIDPTGQFLFCTDLGTDQLHVYRISKDRIDLATSISTAKGSGPRHLVFSKLSSNSTGSLFYLVSELSNTVSVYELVYPESDPAPPPPPAGLPPVEAIKAEDAGTPPPRPDPVPTPAVPTPKINPIQLDVSILPPNHTDLAPPGDWTAAELALSPDEKTLYVSNRAPVEPSLPKTDYMTIFSLDGAGKVVVEGGNDTTTRFVELGGVGPRHFMSSPKATRGNDTDEEGKYMAVAFQRTNEVVVYRVGGAEGLSEVARVGGIEGATAVVWAN